ncbi:SDR family NAD(P)-dependent oxidoreductase [Kineosporia sp. J2-2]|uniref:SDR family NAD(P)-dependent oxidoreductase n=1 Tax=Kineosporia corallincola TaxID=2835133 RepID=A0ABS5TFM2_9ACTN|nr:SDR family NAD(P)-dependent oxidoreductase [Kineosporia corallincola]MBT0769847.1 SDR family NAD(P)-dependent oxidoreductase [Kineosporia corallincola]
MNTTPQTPQKKIGSGFGATTSTGDVLAGIDLTGRLAIVTGGYSGVGLATTLALAGAGARVVVPARRPETAGKELEGVDGVEVVPMDLADLESVRAFAERFEGRSVDLLVASAGIMAPPLERVGPGWESQFAVNHLGHFALVNRLWPALRADGGARVVTVSSRGHRAGGIRWHDWNFEHDAYDKWTAYGQSKSAVSLFAVHLDALGREANVRAFAVHPGVVDTHLQRHLPVSEQIAMGWLTAEGTPPPGHAFKTPSQGAATSVWAATSPQLHGLGGVYLEDCEVSEVTTEFDYTRPGVMPHAIDPGEAARLWTLSAELTGVSGPTA